jgi:hypothetical protein
VIYVVLHSSSKECPVPDSPVSATIHPTIKKLKASMLINRSGGIIEAYDERQNLLGVFKRDANNTCNRIPTNKYNPFVASYRPYLNPMPPEPGVLQQFKDELTVQGIEQGLPVIKQIFHVL